MDKRFTDYFLFKTETTNTNITYTSFCRYNQRGWYIQKLTEDGQVISAKYIQGVGKENLETAWANRDTLDYVDFFDLFT